MSPLNKENTSFDYEAEEMRHFFAERLFLDHYLHYDHRT